MALGKVIGRVAIKVLPDTSDFREQAAGDLRRVRAQLGSVKVDVIPTLQDAAKKRISNELKAWAAGLDLRVSVDLDLNNADLIASAAALEALSKNRKVKLVPELDKGALARVATALGALSGARVIQGMFRNLREEMMNLDKAVPAIGKVSHAVGLLGAMLLGVSGNLFSLSASLATIGPAALALPGLFTGIGIGLATTVAALKDFNVMVPQAKGLLSDLQDIISKNFWAGAADPMRELVDKLFPILNTELAKTSTALGDFFGKFSNSVITGLLPSLPDMFEHLTNSIKIASGYTDNYVGIIEKLGKIGAAYLPRLATFVGDLSKQFDEWLGKMGTDKLTGFVETGITAMKDLGSVIASTTSIFASLAKAAEKADGMTLSSLAESLRGVAEAAKDPAFQKGLTATLKAAFDMLSQIGDIAGPALKGLVVAMSENFQKLAPIMGDTIGTALEALATAFSNPAVGKGLEAMFQGFNDMVHILAPTMDLIAEKMAIVGELVGSLARNIGTVLAAAIVTLKPLFIGFVEALIPIVDMLGPMLGGVIKALGPVFAVLGDALTKAAVAIRPMFSALQDLVNLLMPILVPVLKVLATVIGGAIVGVIQGATLVFRGLVNVVEGVVNVFKGFGNILAGLFTLDFGRMWDGLKQVFSGLGQILLGALQAAFGAVWAYMNGTVLGFFKGFAAKLLGPLKGPLGKAFEPLKAAGGKIASVFGEIARVVGPILTNIGAIVATVFTFIGDHIGSILNGVLGVVTSVFTFIVAFISVTLNTVWTVISTIWTVISFLITTALTTIWNAVVFYFDLISVVIGTVMAVISTVISTVWNAIVAVVQTVIAVILSVVTSAWDHISSVTQTVMGVIGSVVSTVWNAIESAIRTTVQAVQTIVTTIWNAIKTTTETVFNAIKSTISTIWNSIKSTVETVVNGVKSTISSVFGDIKSNISGSMETIKSTISNAWDSVKSTVTSAWGKVQTAVSTGVGDAVGEVKKLPQKALDALSGLGTLLYDSGVSIIQGFINGITAMGDKVAGAVKGVMGKARNMLPFSPAKEGPFSGKGWTLYSGRSIVTAMADGITEKTSTLTRALSDTLGKAQRIASGSAVGDTLVSSIASGINAGTADVVDAATTMAKAVADELKKAFDKNVTLGLGADFAVPEIQSTHSSRRLAGLEKQVTTAARTSNTDTQSTVAPSVEIGAITIPLEDLKQLKDLEEFLDLLRVRIRQG